MVKINVRKEEKAKKLNSMKDFFGGGGGELKHSNQFHC